MYTTASQSDYKVSVKWGVQSTTILSLFSRLKELTNAHVQKSLLYFSIFGNSKQQWGSEEQSVPAAPKHLHTDTKLSSWPCWCSGCCTGTTQWESMPWSPDFQMAHSTQHGVHLPLLCCVHCPGMLHRGNCTYPIYIAGPYFRMKFTSSMKLPPKNQCKNQEVALLEL